MVMEMKTEDAILWTEDIRKLMADRMILEEDVRQVLAHAAQTGKRIKNSETGRLIAYHKPAAVTYWVEYTESEEGILIHNTYSHRLEIGE